MSQFEQYLPSPELPQSAVDEQDNPLFSTAYSMGREAKLLTLGVSGAVVDTVRHPLSKLPELGVSVGIGFALGVLSQAGASGRLIATGIGTVMLAKFEHDELNGKRWSKFGSAVADAWHSGRNMDRDIQATKDSLGSFVIDLGIGYGGMKIGATALSLRLSSMRFLETNTGTDLGGDNTTPSRFSYDALRLQMNSKGISEQGIAASIKPDNSIGRGGNATVYKIDGLGDFVLRVPGKRGNAININGAIEPVTDIMPDLNIGQPVARLGDATILKMQEGIPAGGPLLSDAKAMGSDAARSIYDASVKRAASMPQSAYDEFARTLLKLDENRLNFDPSKANNVLIDVPNQRFNVVDISPRNPSSTYRHSVSHMITTLMDNGFINTLQDRGAPLSDNYQEIVSKSVAAAENSGLPIDLQSSSLKYSFQLARMNSLWGQLHVSQGIPNVSDLPILEPITESPPRPTGSDSKSTWGLIEP